MDKQYAALDKEQFVIAILTGLVTLLLGLTIVFISQADWNLLVVGFGLTVIVFWHRLMKPETCMSSDLFAGQAPESLPEKSF